MVRKTLPAVSGRKVIAALRKAGFELDRLRGSHHVLLHRGPPVRGVSVPVHGNRSIPKGTLRAIVEQAGPTVQEFIDLL